MDAEIKGEIIKTLRAAREAAERAEQLFTDLKWFFRAEVSGRPNVLTVANIIAKGVERGLKAKGESDKSTPVHRPEGIESP